VNVFETLGIHWQTMLAQAVTFLVLLALMQRFLFGPVSEILRARAGEVKQKLDDAEDQKRRAGQHAKDLEERLRQIHEEARREVQRAAEEGRAAAQRIIEQAHQEAGEALRRGREQLEHDRRAARIELRNQVVDLSVRAAARAIREVFDENAHRRAVDRFLSELELEPE
jgi:F-type H+-transporting ATPase subunit b